MSNPLFPPCLHTQLWRYILSLISWSELSCWTLCSVRLAVFLYFWLCFLAFFCLAPFFFIFFVLLHVTLLAKPQSSQQTLCLWQRGWEHRLKWTAAGMWRSRYDTGSASDNNQTAAGRGDTVINLNFFFIGDSMVSFPSDHYKPHKIYAHWPVLCIVYCCLCAKWSGNHVQVAQAHTHGEHLLWHHCLGWGQHASKLPIGQFKLFSPSLQFN